MNNLEWKDIIIDGIEYDYSVSNMGDVYSKKNNKFLNKNVTKKGYLEVTLYKDGIPKICKIHRLVALMFIPNPNNFPEVNHEDTDKTNNQVSNLTWCTGKENMNHASINGLLIKPIGEAHHYANYSDEIAKLVCGMIQDGFSNSEIMDKLNIAHIDFIKCIRSKTTYVWLSKYYNFPKYTNEQILLRETARRIKTLIKSGYSNKDIRFFLNLPNDRRTHDLIKNLRSNKIYKDIVCDKYLIVI